MKSKPILSAKDFDPRQVLVCEIKQRIPHMEGYFVEIENIDAGAFLDSSRKFREGETVTAYFVSIRNNVIMLSEHAKGPDNFKPDNPFNPKDPSRVPKKPYPSSGELSGQKRVAEAPQSEY